MKLIRVGDKVISWDKVSTALSEILHRRSRGATQQEVASALGVERSFVSYLEGIGAIRRGRRLALVGFPIGNQEQVRRVAEEFGVEFVYLLSEAERQRYVREKTGAELFNEILETLAKLKDFDTVVVLASDRRIAIIEKILDKEIVSLPIGVSPLTTDRNVDVAELRRILRMVGGDLKEAQVERGSQRQPWLFKKRSRRRGRAARAKI